MSYWSRPQPQPQPEHPPLCEEHHGSPRPDLCITCSRVRDYFSGTQSAVSSVPLLAASQQQYQQMPLGIPKNAGRYAHHAPLPTPGKFVPAPLQLSDPRELFIRPVPPPRPIEPHVREAERHVSTPTWIPPPLIFRAPGFAATSSSSASRDSVQISPGSKPLTTLSPGAREHSENEEFYPEALALSDDEKSHIDSLASSTVVHKEKAQDQSRETSSSQRVSRNGRGLRHTATPSQPDNTGGRPKKDYITDSGAPMHGGFSPAGVEFAEFIFAKSKEDRQTMIRYRDELIAENKAAITGLRTRNDIPRLQRDAAIESLEMEIKDFISDNAFQRAYEKNWLGPFEPVRELEKSFREKIQQLTNFDPSGSSNSDTSNEPVDEVAFQKTPRRSNRVAPKKVVHFNLPKEDLNSGSDSESDFSVMKTFRRTPRNGSAEAGQVVGSVPRQWPRVANGKVTKGTKKTSESAKMEAPRRSTRNGKDRKPVRKALSTL